MKINLFVATLFLSVGISSFAAMPCNAESVQQEAVEIKAEEQAAAQSQSSTESRDVTDEAWDGADHKTAEGDISDGTVDIIGGDEGNEPKDEETSFDNIEKEDVTPWKGTITGIVASFMSGLGLMLIAATLLASIISDEVTYSRYIITRIAQALFVAAAAAFATAIAFATILMVEYKQYMLGSIWAGIATFSLAEAIYMTYKCQSPASSYDPRLSSGMKLSDNFHKALKTAAILAFVMGGISAAAGGPMTWYSYKKAADSQQTSQTDTSKHDEGQQEENVVQPSEEGQPTDDSQQPSSSIE